MKEHITILLVDDDEDDRKLFSDAVMEVDKAITCNSAANAQEALTILKNEAIMLPDIIILDLRMPGISGQKCLEEIKKDPRIMNIPVLIYTTSREVKESIELKKLGAAHFISKPTSPDEVYYLVSYIINENWS
ncbi:response regulator [Ferruginibacter albus]|uniref:response regulator n=1 Tax=Ferruginibacter albus TaxID=2875540 RepID=UPI001CC5F42E|nr:response regulator [Ferruginibacter albus]UAY53091.1 response regulator [Ferruginibacter albus]